MNSWRELIIILLLGFFIGVYVGQYDGRKKIIDGLVPFYEKEIGRLQVWNDLLLKTMLSTLPKK